jgi:hypothetical protein
MKLKKKMRGSDLKSKIGERRKRKIGRCRYCSKNAATAAAEEMPEY